MRGFIIGLENIDRKKKDGTPYQGMRMRWGYSKQGIVGADVRSDFVSREKVIFNEFSPYINKLEKLVNNPIEISLMPTGFVFNGEPQMEIVDFHILEK